MEKTVWIMGRITAITPEGNVWSICGVFEKKEDAISYCSEPVHFVAPLLLNCYVGLGTGTWPSIEYPITEENPDGS